MPAGPTSWVVDDLLAPSVLLRDIVELPPSGEARETFFRWKFSQAIAAEEDYSVQAQEVETGLWLLAGLPQSLKEEWLAAAIQVGRPIHKLVPRWLWLFNRLALSREVPGILLSLCPQRGGGGYTGTLVAWARTLILLRQWNEAAECDQWLTDRLNPTVAYLQRESRTPQELWIWGVRDWPSSPLTPQIIQSEIPTQEVL
jgi:hypothetical protein